MRPRLPTPGLALWTALLASGAAAAPPAWLEVSSPHFSVVTNAGEKAGRRTAWQFEQIRGALLQLWPWASIDSGLPIVVFAARDEATLRGLGPQYWEGKRYRPVSFAVRGADRHFIALRSDVREPDEVGANPYQAAYWSYVSAVFNRSFPRRPPLWYGRGIAEVMSNTIVREKELHVGRPIRENVERLREGQLVPLDELLGADSRSHWLTQESDVRLFDAQAWALTHYLMFGEKGAHQAALNRFNALLRGGASSEAAIREAFGSLAPCFKELRTYAERGVFSYLHVPVSREIQDRSYTSRSLSAGEAAALRGKFLVAMRRPAEARALAAEAAKADPRLPGPWEIEAELLDEAADPAAGAAYRKAADAGSTSASVYYRLAQLDWSPHPDKPGLEHLAGTLEKARSLDPGRANVLSFLAEVRLALGQPEEALSLARKAVSLEPWESYHRLSLARVLSDAGRQDEAVESARSALQTADTEEERRQAQEFLDSASKRSP